MEIDHNGFRKELRPILKNIANATFVTIDLEMSGISTRPWFSSGGRSHNVSKPTLEQQYQEMKSAAETFQVLQIGITCVEVDREKEFYLAHPYNFYMTPLSADAADEKKVGDLKLERVFSFSGISSGFLHSKQFDFGKVFTHGIPYLSRDEEAACREEFKQWADNSAKLPYVPIPLDEPKTLAFYNRARQTIHDWRRHPTPAPTVNIVDPDGPLNGFQRLLVYQLIRDEFPTLKGFGKDDGAVIEVRVFDHEKEAQFQAKRLIKHNDKIAKQKGLTWIFEALVGGDLSGIQPEWFASTTSDKSEDQLPYIKVELAKIITILQKKKHIIVGHNVFTELGFIYKTFIGKLPATVKNFQAEIHVLYPNIFDTKYMVTHNESNSRADLKDLLDPFREVHVPLIVLHEHHIAYGAPLGKEHEAGFDSWMTAELFIKSSAKLFSNFKHSRSVKATRMPAYGSDAEFSSSSIYGSTLNVRGNLSFEKQPPKSAHLSVSCDEVKGYYSDEEDDDPNGGALIDLRSPAPSPKKTDRPLCALNRGSSGVETFFPRSLKTPSNTSARPGSFINGFNHAGPLNAGSFNTGSFTAGSFEAGYFNADLLSGHSTSSQAKVNVNAYPGSASFIPTPPFNPQAGYLGTFHPGNFWNGSFAATPMNSYSTVASGNGFGDGGAPTNAQDYFGSATIQTPVSWQAGSSKRASHASGQGQSSLPPTIMQDNLPASSHARQLDASAIAFQGKDAEVAAAEEDGVVQQWIPDFDHPFWRQYANKVRVFGVEGGVCKFA